MQTYDYKAKSVNGDLTTGNLQAENQEAVIAVLKRKGLFLLSVKQVNRIWVLFRHDLAFLRNRVTLHEKAMFTQQLATLLGAGMQLSIALRTLSKQIENKYFASVIEQVYTDIEQSSSLSQAMSKHPRIFSDVYTAIVSAAEESGTLVKTLKSLSKQLKSQASIRAQLKSAMAYPLFLLCVSVAVVCVLVAFVIPKFIQLFVDANQRLPLPTRILINSTDMLKKFWWGIIVVIVVSVILGILLLRQEHIRAQVDDLLLRLPGIGTLNRKLQLARFARTLGSLISGGVKILPAINITKKTSTNLAFAGSVGNMADKVIRGSTLARAVREQSYFNEIVANMIAVGEDSGALDKMLIEIADMYQQESEAAINSVTSLLGPLMIVFIGLLVGFVVMAILLPIFETSTMIG